jgi:hypothetical protein
LGTVWPGLGSAAFGSADSVGSTGSAGWDVSGRAPSVLTGGLGAMGLGADGLGPPGFAVPGLAGDLACFDTCALAVAAFLDAALPLSFALPPAPSANAS